ncbi:glutamyl aminopeptidase [Drosophila sechellia]|uniref:Aminopeptidase n=1 Tax=Drosophila sechellia TaxID=7238 RepID=B4HG89_DROSE|nr:glutamyl aminopeptidase [Drosophila sechellia]EDW42337.1 GM24098 [Drosophila sechellia]
MFLSGYWLQVVLSWAVVAFATATVVVAVQKAQLERDLRDVQDKIDVFEEWNGEGRTRIKREDTTDYRLPTNLVPTHYELYWHPDLETGNFTGQQRISIKVVEATNQIILHSYLLDITSVYVLNREVEKFELEEERQFLIITLTEELPVDASITLGIIFGGQMKDKLVGLYSSTYLNEAGATRTISTTKFEPTYARQAFPCFDEPAMKATFAITVVHPSGSYHAVSNMQQTESNYLGDYTEAIFETSVSMSTYLVCIIVSDFASQTTTVKANGIGEDFSMQAYATSHQINKVEFALEFGQAVTEYYIQYYKVPYPLTKLDMAAIPDFASGAMEHWGLVTYRETALLYDPSYSSTANKQSIAGTLAHEIAHQWFGNLVTMKWWNDLWLNEGFARYMQYKGVNAVHPDWGMLEQFQIVALQPVLVYDAKLSSHPIVQKVESPDEITAIFDTISYEKGGSVIRMLETLVGAEKFEEAVTNYLVKHQFNNTVTDDFLTEVEAVVTDLDIKKLMLTWTEQMGYPVLNVSKVADGSFRVTQQRFLSNPASYEEAPSDSTYGYKWSVPITWFADDGSENSFIYDNDVDSVGIAVPSEVQWIKLNVNQTGYYRVNYEEDLWALLIQQLTTNPARFEIADRGHLLNDAFALADASQLSYKIPLDMTAYLAQERDFVPWYVASNKLRSLHRSLMFSEGYISYLTYARSLIAGVYEEVGWTVDADNHLKNRLRVSILTAACALGVPDCLQQASERFNTFLQTPTSRPSPDLREIVYYYGMQQSTSQSSWDQLFQLFVAETDASEKLKLMYGLSGVRNSQYLFDFLVQASRDESIVRSQDYFTCVQYIAANPVGEPVVWEFYREQWPQLTNRFGLNNRNFGRLIAQITANFASSVKLEEVQHFFSKYPESGAGANSRLEAVETIKYNIEWLSRNEADISNWLSGTASPLTKENQL